jgi:hypothetical protein
VRKKERRDGKKRRREREKERKIERKKICLRDRRAR